MNYKIGLALIILITGCKSDTKEYIQKSEHRISVYNQSKVNQIDSVLQSLISENKAPGIVFGIKIDSAKPIFKSYGLTDISSKRKVKNNDQFRIASITKSFTATAVMQLVERGKLSLDDTIGKFFIDFPKANGITIYHLLSHTSGIPSWYEVKMPDNTPSDFPMCETPHKYIQEANKLFLFEPGEKYYYSNSGYVLLGEIIELVSGDTYEQFLKKNIFVPARMKDTEMEYSGYKSMEWVKGYAFDENDSVPFTEPETYPMPFSAGALRSSVPDLIRFTTSLNSGELLSKESRERMTSYAELNSGKKTVIANFWFPTDFVMPEMPEGLDEFGYGLGFQLMEKFRTPVIFHVGSISGFQSYLVHIPKSNTTVGITGNTNGENGGIASKWKEIQKIMVEIE